MKDVVCRVCAQSRPALEGRVDCRARPSGGANTQCHISSAQIQSCLLAGRRAWRLLFKYLKRHYMSELLPVNLSVLLDDGV